MYKVTLLDDLYQDYKDSAEKYQALRNTDADAAMKYVERMVCIGKCIKYTQRMIDGTMGKQPLEHDPDQYVAARPAGASLPAGAAVR